MEPWNTFNSSLRGMNNLQVRYGDFNNNPYPFNDKNNEVSKDEEEVSNKGKDNETE